MIVELRSPQMRIQGIISMQLIHARTGLVARDLTFQNLIVDAGLNGIASNVISALTDYCAVGTGVTAPANAQTQLVTEVVRTNSAGGFGESRGVASDLSYTWWRRTRVFTTGQANAALTEVGFFQNAAGAPMFSRQLIKDERGNATTLTKTAEFILRVIYEVRWYIPAQSEYAALIDQVSRTIRTRAARVLNGVDAATRGWRPDGGAGLGGITSFGATAVYSGSLGLVTAQPSGLVDVSTRVAFLPYVPGSFELVMYSGVNHTVVNGVVINSFSPGYTGSQSADMVFQHEIIGAGVQKTSVQRFDIFSQVSWGRYS